MSTFDEIKEILKDTTKKVNELAISQAKTDEQMSRTDEQMVKTDEKLDKLAISQAKTDEQMSRTDEKMSKTDEKLDKLAISQAKTDQDLKKLSKEIRNFIGNYGQSVEEFFYHSLEESKKLGNSQFDIIRKNLIGIETGAEYDIAMFNGDCVAIVEVKSKLHVNDISKLLEKKIAQFKQDFTQYKGFKHYFALASMVTYQDLIDACREEGIFLFTQKGNHIEYVREHSLKKGRKTRVALTQWVKFC